MGMESYIVPDTSIVASSKKDGREAQFARLTGPKFWSPRDNDDSPYLEVKFESLKRITSILTQGGANGEMVREFSIQYVPVEENQFQYVMGVDEDSSTSEENIMRFNGNTDDSSIKENILKESIVTKRIRIFPIRQSPEEKISLRIELKGCDESMATTPYVVETASTTSTKTTLSSTTQKSVETTTTKVSRSTPLTEVPTQSIVVTSTTKSVISTATTPFQTQGEIKFNNHLHPCAKYRVRIVGL